MISEKKWLVLTKSEKRVHIAKDILKSIKLGEYIATRGLYIDTSVFERTKGDHDEEVRDILRQKRVKGCKVCALGSCLLSLVKFENNMTLGYIRSGTNFMEDGLDRKRLEKYFSINQLGLIEGAFEASFGIMSGRVNSSTQRDKAVDFSFKGIYLVSNVDTLVAIMKNIIKNKGTFKP